jgi:penicillin-insensitive murein endopeptidase
LNSTWNNRNTTTIRGLRLLAIACLTLYGAAARGDALPANAWSRVPGPSAGETRAIGGFAHGCLAGGVALPPDGDGYEVIRLSRKRNFGHGETVGFVRDLGLQAKAAGLPPFYVGDMAQARGGPLPFGHASHQSGLDVDLWFTFDTGPKRPAASREQVDLPSMLLPGAPAVDPQHFGQRQLRLLRLAAADPRVERIFVSPVIKLALCRGYGALPGGTGWLHRLSPWWGHDDHFHVRLRCPADSPDCESQPPVPPGDGCDAGLAHWAAHPFPPVQAPNPAPPHPKLPAACTAILTAPESEPARQ